MGGPRPPVGPAGSVLGSLPGHPPLRLLAGLEGSGRDPHQPGPDLPLQEHPGPLQVGGQPRGGGGGGRLGVRGGHKQERGGGEARRRNRVPAGSGGLEGLPSGSAAVRGLWGGNDSMLTPPPIITGGVVSRAAENENKTEQLGQISVYGLRSLKERLS